ncbi:MAG TPA: galactokinase [Pyrinomonadaceae bacterium]|nr:galactokinase [Pyrinomonadaceae bacterium]
MEIDIGQLVGEFGERFGAIPRLFRAPGRVNLIGEHTDYNEGFVMPFAIDRHTIVAAHRREDTKVNVFARDLDSSASIDLRDEPVKKRGDWIDYVEGTVRCVAEEFGDVSGADMIITSSVPIGGGLSSSAAIEVSVGLAMLSLNEIDVDRKRLAFAAQKAEHEFVGTRSGIMDQFTSVFAKEGHAMLLDCRSLDVDYIPLAIEDVDIVVIDTKVKHSLASSEYNKRREECEKGVELLREVLPDIRSLRDVTEADLKEYASRLPDVVEARCRHVVTENKRTIAAAAALREKDFRTVGDLMFESHRSLRDDYEVSCPELDLLVYAAAREEVVYGSRMTGGGFGGCTVTLVRQDATEELTRTISDIYSARFGRDPEVYTFKVANGASELTI